MKKMMPIMLSVASAIVASTVAYATTIYPEEEYPSGYEFIKSGWPVASAAVSGDAKISETIDLFSIMTFSQVLKELYTVGRKGFFVIAR